MDRDPKGEAGGLPQKDDELDRKGRKASRELDDIPAPGADPLHEGP